jgi:hypothetical protein
MVFRCNPVEVEEDGVACLCTWDLCEIRCLCEIRDLSFLAAPPRPYMGARSRDPVQIGYRCLQTLTSLGLLGLRVSPCSWVVAGRPTSRTRGVIPSSVGMAPSQCIFFLLYLDH